MVGFGGYGVGVGLVAIIMSVIIGFWYAANYEYITSDYSGENTRAQVPELQGESLPEASSVTTDDNTEKSSGTVPLGLSFPIPADKPRYGEVQARWTTAVNLMLSRYSSLQAFEERQTTLQPIPDDSVDSDNSPMLGSGSTLNGENQPASEITEADFDDKNDKSHKDRPEKATPKAPAEKGEESEMQESDEEQAENADIDDVIIDELDELVDELEDQGDEILDAVNVADGLELAD
ncbi:MAG TPA: hypothetical protein VGQ03_09490 [Nitrososphaera sp.]|nr:hypothetical protein [Nitrososphaera sp.]